MALFTVDHEVAPFPCLVEGFDIFDAARKYKTRVERQLLTDIVDGERLTVCTLENTPEGVCDVRPVTLKWLTAINNFKKVD